MLNLIIKSLYLYVFLKISFFPVIHFIAFYRNIHAVMDWKFKKERVAPVTVRSPALYSAASAGEPHTSVQWSLSSEWQGRQGQGKGKRQ